MPKITARISDQSANWLSEMFATKTSGAELIIDAFPTICKRVLAGFRDRFSANELALMIDNFNGLILTPQMLGQHVLANVADGIALDHQDKKWQVNKEDFLDRLKALAPIEHACLEIWLRGFWESPTTGGYLKEPGSMEAWISQLTTDTLQLEG